MPQHLLAPKDDVGVKNRCRLNVDMDMVVGGPDRDRTDDLFHAMIWVEG
jgi:hypothetical protein